MPLPDPGRDTVVFSIFVNLRTFAVAKMVEERSVNGFGNLKGQTADQNLPRTGEWYTMMLNIEYAC